MEDREVFNLLLKIDNGYKPTSNEKKFLSAIEKITWKRVDKIPKSTGLLYNLKQLTVSSDINNAKEINLPKSIENLINLQILDLNSVHINELPYNLGNLTRLKIIDVGGTNISKLPDSIRNLSNLQILNLGFTKISTLPYWIGKLDSLQSLNLNSTKISKLPESIFQLKRLERLSLSHTNIDILPQSIYSLRRLQSIDLSYTKIKQFPDIWALYNLQSFCFQGCSYLSGELSLPRGLTSIDDNAFSGCSGLSGRLHLPEGLTSIGASAFAGCSGLDGELHLPSRLTSIGASAFSGCSGLSGRLHLPSRLTSIGASAFSGCSGLSGRLHLPSRLTSIGASAFAGCSGLSGGLHMPGGLTSIGDNTFSGCSSLNGELLLPDGLINIGDSAFSGCSSLSGELHLPEGVTSIGNNVFSGCSGLSGELHLPKGVTSVGNNAFAGCSGLRGELHLPEGLISIGTGAFSGCSGLRGELHLPEGLTSIGASAFSGCSSLSGELCLPEELTEIGNRAFSYCSGLSGNLYLPEGLSYIGNEVFLGCSGLNGKLYLPRNLTVIGEKAYSGNSGLRGELHLPEGLTSIGDMAFYGCSGLFGELHLPKGLTSIGKMAFYGCSGLSGQLVLPEKLSRIGERAFYGCDGLLEDIYLPPGLDNIGDEAFKSSERRGQLDLPDEMTAVNDYAYHGNSGLIGVLNLPKAIKNIGSHAFYGCSGLSGGLHLPGEIKSIGAYAFYGCTGLSGELKIPDGVISIGEEAFSGCSGLQLESSLPETLKIIGVGAFNGTKHTDALESHPKAIFDSSFIRKTGVKELENERQDIIGRFYVRLEEIHLYWKCKTRKRKDNEAYLPIPSAYAYAFDILKGNVYYSRLFDDQNYIILKATGSQSRRKYAKQFVGNNDLTVLYNWYKSIGASIGDYIIVTIYDDREISLDYISQSKTFVLEKYNILGNKGRIIVKNSIKEKIKGFRLVSLFVKDNEDILMDYIFFPDGIQQLGEEPVTTIIVGENGSGKSYTLKILTEIFLAVQNEGTRNSLTYSYYHLVYILRGQRISIEISGNKVEIYVDEQYLEEFDTSRVLPTKVLALAFMLNDKYVFKNSTLEDEVYEYLGVRGASNAAWTSTFGNRVAENIISLVSDGTLVDIIKYLSAFLNIDSQMSISFEFKEDFFSEREFKSEERLKVAHIQDRIIKIVKKEEIEGGGDLQKDSRRKRIEKNTGQYSQVIYDLLYNKKVYDKGNTSVCEIVFSDKDESIKGKENNYAKLSDLYALKIISNITLYIYKNGQKYSYDDMSSGEKNILYAVLNIAGHLKDNSLVMIDEPEISLHPNWQMLYVSLLKTVFKNYRTCHFLIATHSPYMVSDLNPKSSSLIVLSNKHGKRFMRAINYSTYSWSVENILYNIFHARTIRNYYFEMDLRELIKLVGDENKNVARIKELYEKLSGYIFTDKDPLHLILQQAQEYIRHVES